MPVLRDLQESLESLQGISFCTQSQQLTQSWSKLWLIFHDVPMQIIHAGHFSARLHSQQRATSSTAALDAKYNIPGASNDVLPAL
ncbi:hypothetical protein DMENIID0001_088130 [Sergentomyia squamirostris]